MAAPTVGPKPGTMFTTPGGNPTWEEQKWHQRIRWTAPAAAADPSAGVARVVAL